MYIDCMLEGQLDNWLLNKESAPERPSSIAFAEVSSWAQLDTRHLEDVPSLDPPGGRVLLAMLRGSGQTFFLV